MKLNRLLAAAFAASLVLVAPAAVTVMDAGSAPAGVPSDVLTRALGKAVVIKEALMLEDLVWGVLEVKIGKVNKKTGMVKVNATANLGDGSSYKAVAVTVPAAVSHDAAGRECAELAISSLRFGSSGFIVMPLTIHATSTGAAISHEVSGSTVGEFPRCWVSGACEASDSLNPGAVLKLNYAAERYTNTPDLPDGNFDFVSPYPGFEVATDKLPQGLPVTKEKTRLVCPKHASGLRLSYAAKSQVFKGKFNVLVEQTAANGKTVSKKVPVTLTGVIYKGKGYGYAAEGGSGSRWPVRIE